MDTRGHADYIATLELCRDMERERDELKCWTSVNGVIDLQRERDEARAESIRWQSIAEGRGRTDDEIENDTQCELAAWELLREAQAENIGWQKKWQVAVEMAALAQNELAAVTAQRDEAREQLARAKQAIGNLCEDCGGWGMIPGTEPNDDVMNTPCPCGFNP